MIENTEYLTFLRMMQAAHHTPLLYSPSSHHVFLCLEKYVGSLQRGAVVKSRSTDVLT